MVEDSYSSADKVKDKDTDPVRFCLYGQLKTQTSQHLCMLNLCKCITQRHL